MSFTSSHFSSDFESFHGDEAFASQDFDTLIDTFAHEYINDADLCAVDDLDESWEQDADFGLDLSECVEGFEEFEEQDAGEESKHTSRRQKRRNSSKPASSTNRKCSSTHRRQKANAICKALVLEYLKQNKCWETHDALLKEWDVISSSSKARPIVDPSAAEKSLQIDKSSTTHGILLSSTKRECVLVQLLNEEILQHMDWNRMDEGVLQTLKEEDEMRFQMNCVRPDEEGYQHEINAEFAEPTEESGWDSD